MELELNISIDYGNKLQCLELCQISTTELLNKLEIRDDLLKENLAKELLKIDKMHNLEVSEISKLPEILNLIISSSAKIYLESGQLVKINQHLIKLRGDNTVYDNIIEIVFLVDNIF